MSSAPSLNRQSPLPLFYQVAEDLKQRLAQGPYRVGQRFISIREVAREYGVSFVTAQRSMARLANEKWLVSRPGRGTLVARKPVINDGVARDVSNGMATRRAVVFWPTHLALGPALQSQLLATLEGIRASLEGYSLAIEFGTETLIEEEQREYLDRLRKDNQGSGFFLVSVPAQVKRYFAYHRVPCVVLGDNEPGIELSAVSSLEERAMYDLTHHLIGKGHRHIAQILSAPRVAGHEARLIGYRNALREAGLAPRAEDEITVPYDRDIASHRFHAILNRPEPVTAAICTGLTLASWFKAVAGTRAHVAYDVDREQTDSGLVPSTMLIWPGEEVGRVGAEMLRAQLDGDLRVQHRTMEYVRLVELT